MHFVDSWFPLVRCRPRLPASLHVAPNAGIQGESGKASEAVSGFSSRIIAVAMVSGEKLERRSQIWSETGKAQPVPQRNTLRSAYAPRCYSRQQLSYADLVQHAG